MGWGRVGCAHKSIFHFSVFYVIGTLTCISEAHLKVNSGGRKRRGRGRLDPPPPLRYFDLH